MKSFKSHSAKETEPAGSDLLQRTDGMGGFMKGETRASLKADYG
jgi:hypothetical protein